MSAFVTVEGQHQDYARLLARGGCDGVLSQDESGTVCCSKCSFRLAGVRLGEVGFVQGRDDREVF